MFLADPEHHETVEENVSILSIMKLHGIFCELPEYPDMNERVIK